MSKSERSNRWFCRVDGSKDFLVQKAKELAISPDTVSMLGAYHVGAKGENPHIHFVIETRTIVQKQSFALKIKNIFAIDKKSQYALGIWDGERGNGACSYLFHEDSAEVICNRGFTEQDIAEAMKANEAVQKVIKLNKEKAQHKLIEKTIEYLQVNNIQFSYKVCLMFMLNEIKQGNNYHPGTFMLKRYIEEIEVKLCNDIELLAEQLEKQLWKQY